MQWSHNLSGILHSLENLCFFCFINLICLVHAVPSVKFWCLQSIENFGFCCLHTLVFVICIFLLFSVSHASVFCSFVIFFIIFPPLISVFNVRFDILAPNVLLPQYVWSLSLNHLRYCCRAPPPSQAAVVWLHSSLPALSMSNTAISTNRMHSEIGSPLC